MPFVLSSGGMRRWGFAAALAGVLTATTACGGGSPQANGSSPSPLTSSAVPSASAASASPTIRPDSGSDSAILAAVRAYVSALTDVAQTASLSPFLSVAVSSCPCVSSENSLVEQLKAKNEHLDIVFTIASSHVLRRSSSNADVRVTVDNSPFHVLSANGTAQGAGKPASTPSTLSLQREGDKWVVFYVDS